MPSGSYLSPLQVGVGTPVGCDAIVHSVASVLEDPNFSPDDSCFLRVDWHLNSVNREYMFRDRIPSGWNVVIWV